MGTVSGNIKQAFVCSFRYQCIILVCQAHDALYNNHIVNQDMDEETISTCIYDCVRSNSNTINWGVHVNLEHRLPQVGYAYTPTPSKELSRIDFHFEADCWECNPVQRFEYYMEAKNLYEHNFKKSSNNGSTSAKYYLKRYVETGVDHVVRSDYPANTLLLGYVLEGEILPVVNSINSQLDSEGRNSEHLVHIETCYESNIRQTYNSMHKGLPIMHLMLKFS